MATGYMFDRAQAIPEMAFGQEVAAAKPLITQQYADVLDQVDQIPVMGAGDVMYGSRLGAMARAREGLAANLASQYADLETRAVSDLNQAKKNQFQKDLASELNFQNALGQRDMLFGSSLGSGLADGIGVVGKINADMIEKTGKGIVETIKEKDRKRQEKVANEAQLTRRGPVRKATDQDLADKIAAEQRMLGGIDTMSLAAPAGATEEELKALENIPYSGIDGQTFSLPVIDGDGVTFEKPVTQRDAIELQIARMSAKSKGLEGDERSRFIADQTSLSLTEAEYLDAVIPEGAYTGVMMLPGETTVQDPILIGENIGGVQIEGDLPEVGGTPFYAEGLRRANQPVQLFDGPTFESLASGPATPVRDAFLRALANQDYGEARRLRPYLEETK